MIRHLFLIIKNKIKLMYKLSHYQYSADLIENPKCHFGRYTYGFPVIAEYNDSTLTVGSFCSIAKGVTVLLGGEHFFSRVSSYPWNAMTSKKFSNAGAIQDDFSKGDIVIGNDVWIGRDAKILSGVEIGDGAVIGAGAIVSRDIPPYAIAVGNPIRILRYRFDEATIKALLKIRWWDWEDEKINRLLPLLTSESPERFIVHCLGNDWRVNL